jgi:hypothetical protein
MADQRLAQLVKQLAKKTAERAISWEKTEEEASFQTAFPGYSVRLRVIRSASGLYAGATAYAIQIFNELGELVEETTDEELDGPTPGEFYTSMKAMYTGARRSVMGVDKAIDSILQRLADNT